jgi:hypothetical protein
MPPRRCSHGRPCGPARRPRGRTRSGGARGGPGRGKALGKWSRFLLTGPRETAAPANNCCLNPRPGPGQGEPGPRYRWRPCAARQPRPACVTPSFGLREGRTPTRRPPTPMTHRGRVLGAERQPHANPQRSQQRGRGRPYVLVGGEAADERRRGAHEDQRCNESGLAPPHVRDTAKEDGAQRADDKGWGTGMGGRVREGHDCVVGKGHVAVKAGDGSSCGAACVGYAGSATVCPAGDSGTAGHSEPQPRH